MEGQNDFFLADNKHYRCPAIYYETSKVTGAFWSCAVIMITNVVDKIIICIVD